MPNLKHNPQILIVEDDKDISHLMAMVLEKEDHWQPTTVHRGDDAIEAWNNGDFDVILMDIQMPGLNGLEATKQIREHENRSGLERTPIIAFTARVTSSDREGYVEAGFDDIIVKPANMQDVIEIVYKHLDGKNPKESDNI